jgi:hypothetical protein
MNYVYCATGIAQMVQCPVNDPDDRGTGVQLPAGARFRIYSHNLRTFFPSLAAEKSGSVKYADFFFVEVLIFFLFPPITHVGFQNSEFSFCCTVPELFRETYHF